MFLFSASMLLTGETQTVASKINRFHVSLETPFHLISLCEIFRQALQQQ